MTPVSPISMLDLSSVSRNSAASQEARIQDSAQQFEALMVGEMLKAVREANSGDWLGTGEDQAGMQAMDYAQMQFAEAIAKGGGLGLGKMIAETLRKNPASEPKVDSGHTTQRIP